MKSLRDATNASGLRSYTHGTVLSALARSDSRVTTDILLTLAGVYELVHPQEFDPPWERLL